MIQGTMSAAGKSMIVAGLCRIFSDDGYRVAPFKSQNMALNSYVTKEGLEIGRAQAMQAECARIEPIAAMNPILLKPTSDTGSQVIINGREVGNMSASEYFENKAEYKKDILRAFKELSEISDIIVIEGAGSPVEMNLKNDDIVNMGLAEMTDAPVILVGDIDRGGVFAQLLGTLDLLDENERARVQGLIVNKFRGDKSLFEDGIRILEERGDTEVLGVVPYLDIQLDDEDSLSERFNERPADAFDIAVIKLSHISNFTDLDAFGQIEGLSVRYVSRVSELKDPDMIVIPGTKNTIADLREIKNNGLFEAVRKKADEGLCIFGLCGGYQMLGRKIEDPDCLEAGGSEEGLCLLPVDTLIKKEKTRTNVTCKITGATGILKGIESTAIEGYEIHMGQTLPCGDSAGSIPGQDGCGEALTEFTPGQTGYCLGNVYGTYIHGFFDKKDVMSAIVEKVAQSRGKTISTEGVTDYKDHKEKQYDLLAERLRESLNMKRIYEIMGLKNDIG
ncbi:MAG: cobyric acid synthase [Lachnospiraceae bacterium]|nr:cobyric acid synthase [Lachnospiraceae bacterium]